MIGADIVAAQQQTEHLREQLLRAQRLSSAGTLASRVPRRGGFRIQAREGRADQMAEVITADSGVGIPAGQLRLMFGPVYTPTAADELRGGGSRPVGRVRRETIAQDRPRLRVDGLAGN